MVRRSAFLLFVLTLAVSAAAQGRLSRRQTPPPQPTVSTDSNAKPPEPTPPKPATTEMRVTTVPGNAQVYVDGVYKGQTDDAGLLVVASTPGEHQLRLDRADYKEWQGKVTLAGERSEQKIEMVKRGPEPLSADEIDQALGQGMTPVRLGDLVKKYGVNFAVTADVEKRLRDRGADSDLLLIMAQNRR